MQGTIKVETGATMRAKGAQVIGNVQGENAKRVNVVKGSHVGGSVQVVQGALAKVKKSTIEADVLYDENAGRVRAISNRVGGNIQAFKNSGGVEISTNRVDGNLQCKENEPRRPEAGTSCRATRKISARRSRAANPVQEQGQPSSAARVPIAACAAATRATGVR